VPHDPQNRLSGGLDVPQELQIAARALPQLPQNRWPGDATVPQFEQVTPSLAPPASPPKGNGSAPPEAVPSHRQDNTHGPWIATFGDPEGNHVQPVSPMTM
jgi:hypothetical protein